ncbi:MAG: transaldolase family protein, partial [Candidatus Binataceae bacterium]
MKYFIDSAEIKEIREAASWGLVDGVTTNPSLIAKSGRPYADVLKEICELVDGPVSAEVVAAEAPAMLEEGVRLTKIHPNIVVKCPLTIEGLKATNALSRRGIRVNVTLIFSPLQG